MLTIRPGTQAGRSSHAASGLPGRRRVRIVSSGCRQDPVVPPVNGEFLHERLPHSKLDILETGHFAWEDGADEYAALVTSWWAGGYATTAGSHA